MTQGIIYVVIEIGAAKYDPLMPDHALCYDRTRVFETFDLAVAQQKAEALRQEFTEVYPQVQYVVGTVTYQYE